VRKFYLELNSNKYAKFLFGCYIILLLIVSFVGININLPTRLYGNYGDVLHNLVPFNSIRTSLFNFHQYNFNTWFYNTIGNILLFIPLGILLPLVFANIKRFIQIFFLLFMGSFTIEILQYVTLLGVFDIDDIILNILGGILGYLILILIVKMKKKSLFN